MKMKWMLLFSLLSLTLQAQAADQAVVIDSQSMGAPAVVKPDDNAATPSAPNAEVNATNKETFIKGGRMSPREKAAVAKAAMADTNKQAGENFLAINKAKPGVVSLASGVQYKILRAGKGKMPTEASVIRCRYEGTLIDGTSFDKAGDKKAAVMHVAGFLPGLNEAVKLMPIGSRWEIVVPPQLAYGVQGNRGVGPNAVVIYTMEILSVK